jgi:HlyD family secretion protein
MKVFRLLGLGGLCTLLVTGCGGGGSRINPSGTLESTETDLSSTLAGRIVQVRPNLGDHVSKDDTLIVLDVELLRLQRAQTEANRLSIGAQRQVAGDALNQAERQLELAKTTLGRTQALFAEGSATPQQVDEVRTRRDVADAQVSASWHQLDALSAEEHKLEATLSVFDRQLRDGIITAPVAGTIILRNAEPGETATPGSVLLRLANLSTLELRVYLGERELGRVKIGQEFPVLVDALKGETLSGRVTWISAEAEFTPKNVQTRDARTQLVYAVKLSVPNPSGRLHIGMPAEVKLQ